MSMHGLRKTHRDAWWGPTDILVTNISDIYFFQYASILKLYFKAEKMLELMITSCVIT